MKPKSCPPALTTVPGCFQLARLPIEHVAALLSSCPLKQTAPFAEICGRRYVYSIPPCLWSHEDPTLPDPPRLFNSTRLTTIARYSTNPGRYGAMALWQMRGAYVF